MLAFLIVLSLLAAAVYVFAKGLVAPMREALVSAPSRVRGLLGTQTMAGLQRQAAAEVSRRALVSISARHLPNDILVLLHPEDHSSVATLQAEFCEGVAELLEAAVRNGGSEDGLPFRLLAAPKVRIKADARISRGTVGVVASILEKTEMIRPGSPGLLVLEMDGRQVALEGGQVVGRSRSADIVLQGAGVSREHARLSTIGTTVDVHDLGGPNGTLVNGTSVEHGQATVGDRISFGPDIEGLVRLSDRAVGFGERTTEPLADEARGVAR